MTYRRWTPAENDFLREQYRTLDIATVVAHLPGRTRQSIYNQVRRLDLVKRRGHNMRWTPARTQLLRDWCGLATAVELAERLGTTVRSVRSRMTVLGLRRNEVNRARFARLRQERDQSAGDGRLRVLLAVAVDLIDASAAADQLGCRPEQVRPLLIAEAARGMQSRQERAQ